jgi:hypothetical protein
MIPVEQRIICKGSGDCMTAALASLLELPYENVPYFRVMKDKEWFPALWSFLQEHGYEYYGTGHPSHVCLKECPNVKGHVIASVHSKTFKEEEKITHSVIVDMEMLVVHDPNPNKLWVGEYLWDGKEIIDYWMIGKEGEF